MIVAVFSMPGRDALTARTIELLEGQGGAGAVELFKFLWWVGEAQPPQPVPASWNVMWVPRPPGGSVRDFFEMVRELSVWSDDLAVFEDDVIPCRNLVPYLARRPRPEWFTTYFNPWRRKVGKLVEPARAGGFDCSQAMVFPFRLVRRFAALRPCDLDDTSDSGAPKGQDLLINEWLTKWREPMLWGRSLVQHVDGPRANGETRDRWLLDPYFVGEDFDALTIPRGENALPRRDHLRRRPPAPVGGQQRR